MATFWYDICNDYTLQIRMDQNDPSDLHLYTTEVRATEEEDDYSLTIFIDDEEEEVYLLSSSPDLHDVNLFSA